MKINNIVINGSKIAAYQIKPIRMVAVRVVVGAGAWFEATDEAGYFHLLEHLMMTGTEMFKNRQEIAIYKEKYGISSGASTSYKDMTFSFNFPDIYLEEGMTLIEQILFKSSINFENIKNETGIIEQEFNDSWNSPYKKFSTKIIRHLTGDECNLSNEILGTPQSVAGAKRDDLLKLYKKHFVAGNMCWGISGNFNKDQLFAKLKEIIPKYTKNHQEMSVKVSNWQPKYGPLNFNSRIEQPEVRLNWQLPLTRKLSLADRYGLNQFNYLFGSGSNSALFMRIRQELGLTYGINSHYWNLPNCSYLEIGFSTDVNNIEKIISESKIILNNLLNNKIDDKWIARVFNFMNLSTLMSFNSPDEIANLLVWTLVDNEKPLIPEETNKIAKNIDFNRTQKWLRENINEAKMLTAVMLPV